MRSVPTGSFTRLSGLEALWRAWRQCRRGKRRRAVVAAFELEVDRALPQLHRDLRSGRYHPSPWRLRVIHDPKLRLIAAPAVRDRVVHHPCWLTSGRSTSALLFIIPMLRAAVAAPTVPYFNIWHGCAAFATGYIWTYAAIS